MKLVEDYEPTNPLNRHVVEYRPDPSYIPPAQPMTVTIKTYALLNDDIIMPYLPTYIKKRHLFRMLEQFGKIQAVTLERVDFSTVQGTVKFVNKADGDKVGQLCFWTPRWIQTRGEWVAVAEDNFHWI